MTDDDKVMPRKNYSTSWHRVSDTVDVSLGFADITHIMDLVFEVMDDIDDDPGSGGEWDNLLEHLAYLRKWTVPDYWADLRAGKNPPEEWTVKATPEEAAAAVIDGDRRRKPAVA